jgi:hypothetical protein
MQNSILISNTKSLSSFSISYASKQGLSAKKIKLGKITFNPFSTVVVVQFNKLNAKLLQGAKIKFPKNKKKLFENIKLI